MSDDNYIVLKGWMVNRLNLKGNELIAYALIYGFSQDESSWFQGSIGYIAKGMGVTKNSARNSLKKLQKKGLIERNEEESGGIKIVKYRAVFPEVEGYPKKLRG
ncbi:MAG: helix-turn-helix domain-containing protein, partial [Fulvivirga sp.]|nr:helix-turn-helix domain-containing protein [Fulvivirga sp.]